MVRGFTYAYTVDMQELFTSDGWKITREEATLPDGRTTSRVRAHHASTVHLLAFDDEGKLLLLREYRPFYGAYLWMLPSGHIDKEADMTVAAQRELREETGFRAQRLAFLWQANVSEKYVATNYFFTATDLVHDPLEQDVDELIEVHHVPLNDAYERVISSPFVHLASAYGILRTLKERKDF